MKVLDICASQNIVTRILFTSPLNIQKMQHKTQDIDGQVHKFWAIKIAMLASKPK
jgi:hypothetical protein